MEKSVNEELFEIFIRNFPFVVREKGTVQGILNHKDNVVIVERDKNNRLIGAAVVNKNTILMLCVDKEYRRKGIGSRLLKEAENLVWQAGFDKINVGNGFDYLAPGVPTSKRYTEAENEKLYPGLNEESSSFFERRGYLHSWDCNCFDMRFPLCEWKEKVPYIKDDVFIFAPEDKYKENNTLQKNESYIEKNSSEIVYRFAEKSDKKAVLTCADNAYPEFTQYYRDDALYQKENQARVLAAFCGSQVVGILITGVEDREKSLGSIGCMAVHPAWRGRHIAVNLVLAGTKYLKEIGFREAYLSYTYSGLDHMYGYAGYKICVYFMMAVKTKK